MNSMKNKLILTFGLTLGFILVLSFSSLAAASYSDYWYQTNDGVWHVKDGSGRTISNCWFCDDAAAPGADLWYLIDEYGNMISGGLVQGPDGKYYSLETAHNGHYGMLRCKSGTYDGIPLTLNSNHSGSFGEIMNADGIAALNALYGTKQLSVNSSDCIYSSSFGAPSKGTSGKSPEKGPSTGPGKGLPQTTEINVMAGTIKTGGEIYNIDYSWGNHYLTGYHVYAPTASGKYPVANHTISGPSYLLGRTVYIKTISGPKTGAYDGIYTFEDTGGVAVEYGKDTTMGVPVVDIYFDSIEEALDVTNAGWTTAEIFILK